MFVIGSVHLVQISAIMIGFYSSLTAQEEPQIQPFNFPPNVKLGIKSSVMCLIQGGVKPWTFRWLRNGKSLDGLSNIRVEANEDYSIIFIESVDVHSGGNYTCTVNGKSGQYNYSSVLNVEAPPSWVVKPNAQIFQPVSGIVNITCSATGSPLPTVSWKKLIGTDGGNVDVDNRFLISSTPQKVNLLIKQILPEHSGKYLCEASNGIGSPLRTRTRIAVRVPAKFEEKFTVLTAKRGDSAKLQCNAIGDQPLTVSWKKERQQLSKLDNSRYEIFETMTSDGLSSELVIRSAERDDGAMYTCTAENEYGKDERKLRVLVLEVPAPPLDLKVREVWTRSASVAWSAPYSGNSPITKYVVQYWRDQGAPHRLHEVSVSSSQMTAMVKDLHPGTSYTVKVVAENEVGRGTTSDAASFQTGEEEPSAPPVDISVEAKGPSTIRVSWKAPPKDHWNGQLRGYYVGYKARDSNQPFSYKSATYESDLPQEYFLSNLARGTEYSVVVKAFNSAGSGPASHEAIARTLDGDLPPPPMIFITSATSSSITIRWNNKHDLPVTGYSVHYREDGGSWQEIAVVKSDDLSYTLTGLTAVTVYQIYVTASSHLGKGDPSEVITVKTEGVGSYHASEIAGDSSVAAPMLLDLSILIPVAACLVATVVVMVVACLCVHKIRQRQNLERAITEQQLAYKGTMQRMTENDRYPYQNQTA